MCKLHLNMHEHCIICTITIVLSRPICCDDFLLQRAQINVLLRVTRTTAIADSLYCVLHIYNSVHCNLYHIYIFIYVCLYCYRRQNYICLYVFRLRIHTFMYDDVKAMKEVRGGYFSMVSMTNNVWVYRFVISNRFYIHV